MNLAERLISTANRPWVRNVAAVLFAIFVLFGLFGYLVLPGILKSQAEKAVAAVFHRKITIERIEVRPYALAVSIHGVKLMEPDGQGVFASFQDLQVRASAASLVYLAPVIKEVHLAGPFVHLVRTGPNRYSADDIVAAVSARRSAGQGAVAGVERGARFSVYNIRIDGGRVEFDDQPEHAHHTVADVKLGIPFISSLPSQEEVFVEPLLSAVINGAPLLIQGRARPFAEPREAVVNLDLDRVDLPRYLRYLPFEPRFKMPGAQLDLHLQASFQQPRDRPAALILTGKATIGGLQVTSLDDQPILKLPQFAMELGNVDLLGGRIEISRVSAAGLDVNVIRDARGQLNLAMLVPPGEPSSAAPVAATPAAGQSATPGGPAVHVAIGQIALQDAAVRFSDRDPARPIEASVDQFALRIADTALDLQARQLAIGQLDSDGARFRLQQGRTGVPSPGAGDRASEGAAVSSAGRPTGKTATPALAGAPPWSVSVGRVSIGNWDARIESRGLPQLAVTTVHALTLAAENLSTTTGAPGRIELKARVNKRGSLSIAGSLGLIPVHADLALDLSGVDLLALQPYITERINLLVTQADLSTIARLMLDQNPDGTFKGGFQGQATLGNLATIDKLDASDFLSWKSLFLGGLNVRMAPLSVNIDQIALSDFFARVIVDPSGHINLQDIVRSAPGEQRSLTTRDPQAPAAPTLTPTPPAVSTPEPAAVTPIRIRQVTLKAGSVRYTDNFIKPNYTANLVDLGGAITGLSSQADSLAEVDLRGQVNSAPLTVAGQINPIKGDLFVDLKASVHDMELAPLSPYSGKYAGYGIERGKLSFDVAYKLEHRQLSAENRLVLDQLTFGDKVDSPTATTLPVQLAVALLKDRNGVIDVNLPIGGSLDDPQFSAGGVIVKVIVNLVTKAVTAPFALLGKLFGGGEELSFIEFDSGRAEIAAPGESRLKSLATALNERPGLKLEIGAWVDLASDRDGLGRQKLDRSVRTMKVKDLVGKGESATVESVIVLPEEYPALLERVYKAQNLPAPRSASGTQPPLPPAEIEKSLLASMQIGDDELTALGNRRAQSVKQWLQNTGQVPEQRLFLVATRVGASADASPPGQSTAKTSRIEFSLK